MQIELQKRSLAVFALSMIFAAVVAWLFVYPRYKAYSEKKDVVDGLAANVEELSDKLDRVRASYEKIKSQQQKLDALQLFLPDTPNTASIYSQIESLVRQTNLVLASVTAVDEVSIPTPKQGGQTKGTADNPDKPLSSSLGILTATFEVKGSQEALQAFLKNLERSQRLFELQSIDVAGSPRGLDNSYKINVRTYYQKAK